jgi:hypothetical protein
VRPDLRQLLRLQIELVRAIVAVSREDGRPAVVPIAGERWHALFESPFVLLSDLQSTCTPQATGKPRLELRTPG